MGNIGSETIVKPADVECNDTVCTATFDDFSDNVSGDKWVFRVRTTDSIVSTSNWAAGQITPTRLTRASTSSRFPYPAHARMATTGLTTPPAA